MKPPVRSRGDLKRVAEPKPRPPVGFVIPVLPCAAFSDAPRGSHVSHLVVRLSGGSPRARVRGWLRRRAWSGAVVASAPARTGRADRRLPARRHAVAPRGGARGGRAPSEARADEGRADRARGREPAGD